MTTDMTTDTTTDWTVRISARRRKDFDACVAIVKAAGGVFDPETKTWAITAEDGRDGMAELDEYSRGTAHLCYAKNLTVEQV